MANGVSPSLTTWRMQFAGRAVAVPWSDVSPLTSKVGSGSLVKSEEEMMPVGIVTTFSGSVAVMIYGVWVGAVVAVYTIGTVTIIGLELAPVCPPRSEITTRTTATEIMTLSTTKTII